jgi:hypothetical protein
MAKVYSAAPEADTRRADIADSTSVDKDPPALHVGNEAQYAGRVVPVGGGDHHIFDPAEDRSCLVGERQSQQAPGKDSFVVHAAGYLVGPHGCCLVPEQFGHG